MSCPIKYSARTLCVLNDLAISPAPKALFSQTNNIQIYNLKYDSKELYILIYHHLQIKSSFHLTLQNKKNKSLEYLHSAKSKIAALSRVSQAILTARLGHVVEQGVLKYRRQSEIKISKFLYHS